MKLYEIDKAILECIDLETGEIIDFDKLTELQLAREEKLESVALWIKNLLAEAEAYKKEKQVFADREAAAKNKADSLKGWLSKALGGEKMTTSKVAISFRNSEAVEIEDEERLSIALEEQGRQDLLAYKVAVNKTAIKQAIKSGETFPGAGLVKRQNIQIK